VDDAPKSPRRKTFFGRIRRRLSIAAHNLYVDANRDPRATVLLCGSGRSGTTWLVGVANFDNHYRLMIEPFNRAQVPAVRAFRRRQYLRPSNVDPAYLGPATAIFTGALRDGYVDQLNRRVVCSSRIAKDVRCTLMLGWLRARFPGMRIVYVLRHPCAVAYSRTKLGWDDIREDYLGQPDLIEDHLTPFAAAIRAAKTDFERHVFDWCVENYVAFRQLAADDAHLAFYENFCTGPQQELDRLFAFLGRPYDARVDATLARATTSAFVPGRSRIPAVASGRGQKEPWQERLTPEEIERAYDIVASFGLQRIYGRDALPDLAGAHATFTSATERAPAGL
jgi:hypothetical protein